MISAALFDLDGVVIDTEPIYTGIWSAIERAFPTGIDNFAARIKGTTLPNILATYFPDPEVQQKVVAMLERSEKNMEYPLVDGIIPFLEDLKANRIPAAIVTSSSRRKMEGVYARLPQLPTYFDAILTDGDIERSKPDPDGYLRAARRLGVPIADCVVFEDSYNGLRSGRASGAHVVALATSNPAESLRPLSDAVIDSFSGFSVAALRDLFA